MMHDLLAFALAAFALFSTPACGGLPAAQAQDKPSTEARLERSALWEASTRLDFDRVSDGRDNWRSFVMSLKRGMGATTVMGQLVRQSRFGVSDYGGRLNAWRDLWDGAWGHVQIGLGPRATVYPRSTVQADVTQSAGAWELSAQYTWRTYETDQIHAARPQVAYYVDSWYLRGFSIVIPRPEKWAVTGGVGARRFLDGSRSYVDVEAGLGRSVEFVGPGSDLLDERTAFVSARMQYFFFEGLGALAGLRYSDDGFFRRAGGSAGLLVQW